MCYYYYIIIITAHPHIMTPAHYVTHTLRHPHLIYVIHTLRHPHLIYGTDTLRHPHLTYGTHTLPHPLLTLTHADKRLRILSEVLKRATNLDWAALEGYGSTSEQMSAAMHSNYSGRRTMPVPCVYELPNRDWLTCKATNLVQASHHCRTLQLYSSTEVLTRK